LNARMMHRGTSTFPSSTASTQIKRKLRMRLKLLVRSVAVRQHIFQRRWTSQKSWHALRVLVVWSYGQSLSVDPRVLARKNHVGFSSMEWLSRQHQLSGSSHRRSTRYLGVRKSSRRFAKLTLNLRRAQSRAKWRSARVCVSILFRTLYI
jgi:hypothetical protein